MNDSEFPTIIGPNTKFKGELTFEKGAKILGDFEGTITSTGDLVIASQAAVQAEIEVGNITIECELHGNIAAQGLIELKQSANLEGDLRCGRLIVGEGARFVGHCNVGDDSLDKAPSTHSTASHTPAPVSSSTSEPGQEHRPLDEFDMP